MYLFHRVVVRIDPRRGLSERMVHSKCSFVVTYMESYIYYNNYPRILSSKKHSAKHRSTESVGRRERRKDMREGGRMTECPTPTPMSRTFLD